MKRLLAAVGFLNGLNVSVLADIGCDHGILAKMVLESGQAKEVICSDVSSPSLNKARTLLKNHKNVSFYLSDGFNSLPSNIDTAVIMGMGGHEIDSIINSERNTAQNLILSPQKHVNIVRASLVRLGYTIEKDIVIEEASKFYDIILAIKTFDASKVQSLSEVELAFGAFYRQKSEDLLKKVLKAESDLKKYKKTEQNLIKLEMLSEVKKWQL